MVCALRKVCQNRWELSGVKLANKVPLRVFSENYIFIYFICRYDFEQDTLFEVEGFFKTIHRNADTGTYCYFPHIKSNFYLFSIFQLKRIRQI